MEKSENPQIESVHSFWNTEACGTHFVDHAPGTPEFYEAYRNFRYSTEWHIPRLVPFHEAQGASVLEIGCGNGVDGTMFARSGAQYTGVDLTEAAVESTRRHFEILGLQGQFRTANAEKLPFANASFDFVYSHGVLHHTETPQNAFDEVYRVLKPGGRAIIMLYHRNSFNYHVRIMGYMRLRSILKALSRFPNWDDDRKQASTRKLAGVRGNEDSSVWNIHYENFLAQGWSYFKASNFVHHATDGPECPFAFVYSSSDVRKAFARFSSCETRVAHFPLRKSAWARRWIPLKAEASLAHILGWYLFVYLKK